MAYWRPRASAYDWATGDLAPIPVEGVRFDTEPPSAYQASRLGIRSDTEIAVNRLRGEVFSASEGDIIGTLQQVITPTSSYAVEVVTRDVGAGQDAASVVEVEAADAAAEARADIRAARNRAAEDLAYLSPDELTDQGVQAPEEEPYYETGPATETQVDTTQPVQPDELQPVEEVQPIDPAPVQPAEPEPEPTPIDYAGGYDPYDEVYGE